MSKFELVSIEDVKTILNTPRTRELEFDIYSAQSCGEACWYAREETCRCSCSGTNHGALLNNGTEMPRRNCTIKGVRYILGTTVPAYTGWNKANLWANKIRAERYENSSVPFYRRQQAMNETNAFLWLKSPMPNQQKWSEIPAKHHLVWIREDCINTFDNDVKEGKF